MYTVHMQCHVPNHDQLVVPILLNGVDGPKLLNTNRTVSNESSGE